MSNTNNPEAWAAQERLRFIERSLWWRGQVKRRDLREIFGISLAQASADLQRYFEMNPLAARYDLKAKCYRGEPHMTCQLHSPRLEEALALYLNGGNPGPSTINHSGAPGNARVSRVALPSREALLGVQRAVFFAVSHGLQIRIRYGSMSGRSEAGWRSIAPHAFGYDGYRWHTRAWCETNGDYRDFVLSRIHECEWPVESAVEHIADTDWNMWETLVLVPHPELDETRRQTIATDFQMTDGRLELRTRRAMRDYLLAHLRLPAWDDVDRGTFLHLLHEDSVSPPSDDKSL